MFRVTPYKGNSHNNVERISGLIELGRVERVSQVGIFLDEHYFVGGWRHFYLVMMYNKPVCVTTRQGLSSYFN